ncbi:hybrid sensor histidine kinase/response regulator [Aquimarina sediminis]|uniref:hybrid sensor histidine kinase/response regulator n=1 Tax=Aquimarina sediminis TaxID=2070536 RepID=UPI000CA07F44|nr:response regulator [Aquimarina sediminis]
MRNVVIKLLVLLSIYRVSSQELFLTNNVIEDSIQVLLQKTRYNLQIKNDIILSHRDAQQLLIYSEHITNQELKINIYLLYAELQIKMYNFDMGIHYFDKVKKICIATDDFKRLIRVNIATSISLRSLKKYDEMEQILNESLKLIYNNQEKGSYLELMVLHEIAIFYSYDKKTPRKAISYGKQFFEVLDKLTPLNTLNTGFNYYKEEGAKIVSLELGKSFLEIGDLKNSFFYLEDARNFYEREKTDYEKMQRLYQYYEKYYVVVEDMDMISYYREKRIEYQQLYIENLINSFKYIPKLNNQLFLMEKENLLNNAEIEKNTQLSKKQKTISWLLGIIGSLFFLLAIYYKRRKRYIKQTNKILSLKNEELKEASKIKSRFFSIMAHELKTPIYGVKSLTSIFVEKGNLKPEQIEALKFSGDCLQSLVDNVIALTNIDNEKIQLDNHLFAFDNFINQVLNPAKSHASQNNVNLHLDYKNDNAELLLIGDQFKLFQILTNLLNNAIKFSENGDVYLKIKKEEETISQVKLAFTVIDNGIGIPPDKVHSINELFTKNKYSNPFNKGTEIGLYIVKKLIDCFDSKVYFKSTVGKGTEFGFRITFRKAEKNVIKDELLIRPPDHKKKILVVDDNKINLMVSSKLLGNLDMESIICINANDAHNVINKASPDLILMDINMPKKDGFILTKEIREYSDIPIIAHTAVADKDEIKRQALSCGMNDVLLKPYSREELLRIINKWTSAS